MKKITTILFAVATIFSFTQCSNNQGNEITNAGSRAKVISELMDNDAYMKEVMTAMKTKHGEAIVSTSCDMMKDDKATCTKMMGSMMDMCMTDTGMCKMMVGKTMKMLDDSNLDCCITGKMMMGDEMAMNHGDQSDCCKKGNMMTGKTGKMTATEKLTCCMSASKKSDTKAK